LKFIAPHCNTITPDINWVFWLDIASNFLYWEYWAGHISKSFCFAFFIFFYDAYLWIILHCFLNVNKQFFLTNKQWIIKTTRNEYFIRTQKKKRNLSLLYFCYSSTSVKQRIFYDASDICEPILRTISLVFPEFISSTLLPQLFSHIFFALDRQKGYLLTFTYLFFSYPFVPPYVTLSEIVCREQTSLLLNRNNNQV